MYAATPPTPYFNTYTNATLQGPTCHLLELQGSFPFLRGSWSAVSGSDITYSYNAWYVNFTTVSPPHTNCDEGNTGTSTTLGPFSP